MDLLLASTVNLHNYECTIARHSQHQVYAYKNEGYSLLINLQFSGAVTDLNYIPLNKVIINEYTNGNDLEMVMVFAWWVWDSPHKFSTGSSGKLL